MLILLVAYCPDDVNVAVGNGIVKEGVPATVCWVSIYPPRRQEAAQQLGVAGLQCQQGLLKGRVRGQQNSINRLKQVHCYFL